VSLESSSARNSILDSVQLFYGVKFARRGMMMKKEGDEDKNLQSTTTF